MIGYDVYTSWLMVKASPMHTKPLKHAWDIEILTNYIQNKQLFQKLILFFSFCRRSTALRSSYSACANLSMFPIISACQIPFIKLKRSIEKYFSLGLFIILITFWNKQENARYEKTLGEKSLDEKPGRKTRTKRRGEKPGRKARTKRRDERDEKPGRKGGTKGWAERPD